MYRSRLVLVSLGLLLFLVSLAQAQEVRADLGVTGERTGASLNVDLTYNTRRFFAVARIFIDEQNKAGTPSTRLDNSFDVEGAVGILLRKSHIIVGPLAGVDTQGRAIAGSVLATKFLGRSISYLGYADISVDSTRDSGSRHRLLIDLRKDQKLFLRWDWKTTGRSQEHSRLGVEFHKKFDKINLPVYLEPFWNFVGRQVGVRAGIKL